jgi:hypothetical protein
MFGDRGEYRIVTRECCRRSAQLIDLRGHLPHFWGDPRHGRRSLAYLWFGCHALPLFVRDGLHPSATRREKVINDRVGDSPMTFDIIRFKHGANLGLEKNIVEVLCGRLAYFA